LLDVISTLVHTNPRLLLELLGSNLLPFLDSWIQKVSLALSSFFSFSSLALISFSSCFSVGFACA
jgi:hypothetical protein